eukprot:gene63-86_t
MELSITNGQNNTTLTKFNLIPPVSSERTSMEVWVSKTSIPTSVPFTLDSTISVHSWLTIDHPDSLYMIHHSISHYLVRGNKQTGTYLQVNFIGSNHSTTWNSSYAIQGSTIIQPFGKYLPGAPLITGYFTNVEATYKMAIPNDITLWILVLDTNNLFSDSVYVPNVIRTNQITLGLGRYSLYLPSTYGIINGSLSSYSFSAPIIIPANSVSATTQYAIFYDTFSLSGTISSPNPIPDSTPPWIKSIELIQVGTYYNLIRVVAGDSQTGLYKINVGGFFDLTDVDLATGSNLNGIYERIFYVGSVQTDVMTLTAIDIASNAQLVNGITSSSSLRPRMRLELPYADYDAYVFEGAWNDALGCFQINFTIPQNMVEGKVPYSVLSFPDLKDSLLSVKFGDNAHLSVKCQDGDLMPPMVTNVVAYPSTTVQVGQDTYFGWQITISDRPNGFLRGEINVTASFDPLPYTFKLDPSMRISGDNYEDTALNKATTTRTASRGVGSDDIISPYDLVNYDPTLSPQFSIKLVAECLAIDNTPPEISAIGSPSAINVGLNNLLRVSFEMVDFQSNVSARHQPTVYIQSAGGDMYAIPAIKNSFDNGYVAKGSLPLGFGVPNKSMMLTIYGCINNHLTIGGWPIPMEVQRVYTMEPHITSASPIYVSGGPLTLSGYLFGIEVSKIQTTYLDPETTETWNLTAPSFHCSKMIVVNIPSRSTSWYQIYVTVNGL